MEGIVYDCILLGVLMGLRTMELWEIMTSSDVRAIAQYLKKRFFSKFRVKIECSCSNGSNEPRIFKFPKFRLNCGTSAILWHKFYLKMNFIRVWPWKISCIVAHFVALTQFCGTHTLLINHIQILMWREIMIAQYLMIIAQYPLSCF